MYIPTAIYGRKIKQRKVRLIKNVAEKRKEKKTFKKILKRNEKLFTSKQKHPKPYFAVATYLYTVYLKLTQTC